MHALRFLLHALPVLFAAGCSPACAAPEKPNFIIILADDLGYGDLGCYGHPSIRTPHLDRMAREGVRFTDFYSAAEVCTPSRAALLTGRYPIRSGMCHNQFRVLRNVSMGHLPLGEVTLPELLKEQGYTTGYVGKWHLGVWANNAEGHPKRHGFDFSFGLPHSNDMDPVPGRPKGEDNKEDPDPKWWNPPLFAGETLLEQPVDQTTLTRRYTEQAVKFIGEKKGGPFFLYFAHTFPHTPLFASQSFRGTSPRGRYGDVLAEIDWSVGQVLDAVRGAGIEKNTLVVFTSDNGPWLIREFAGGSAGLLRDGKGSTWEGGMRVPGIAWMPGKVPAGTTCHELASTMDLFATCAAWAGAKVPTDRAIDGIDITPSLTGNGRPGTRGVYLYYRGSSLFAARLGKWKAHYFTQPAYGQAKPEAHEPPLLFDLQADPGENFNLAAQHPEVLAEIKAGVERHLAELKPAPSQLLEVVSKDTPAGSPTR